MVPPLYLMTSGLIYLLNNAPSRTEMMVTMTYADTDPSQTLIGLPVFAAMLIPTSWVLSANSAANIAQNVAIKTLRFMMTLLLMIALTAETAYRICI